MKKIAIPLSTSTVVRRYTIAGEGIQLFGSSLLSTDLIELRFNDQGQFVAIKPTDTFYNSFASFEIRYLSTYSFTIGILDSRYDRAESEPRSSFIVEKTITAFATGKAQYTVLNDSILIGFYFACVHTATTDPNTPMLRVYNSSGFPKLVLASKAQFAASGGNDLIVSSNTATDALAGRYGLVNFNPFPVVATDIIEATSVELDNGGTNAIASGSMHLFLQRVVR